MKKLFGGCFILLITFCLHAENSSQLVLDDNLFNENYNSNVPVSGRVIAGLMLDSHENSSFNINLPKINSGNICLKVQSQDGSYHSTNQYRIVDNTVRGNITPDYPTQYKNILNQLSIKELAILAFEGKCSERKLSNVFVSSRGNADANEVMIFVSSGRSDVFSIHEMLVVAKNQKSVKELKKEKGLHTTLFVG